MTLISILLIANNVDAFAQNQFPRDTSFNIESNYIKTKKYFPNTSPVSPTESSEILSLYNQIYRTRSNRTLSMDIFMPNAEEDKKYPCVIFVHGGGWRSGSKENFVPLAQELAKLGYVTASVEQRLSLEATYPAAVHDVKEAIRFLRHNANTFRIDSTKLAIAGASSGASIAGLMATTGHIATFNDPQSCYPHTSATVQAFINIDGVIDFRTPEEMGRTDEEAKTRPGTIFLGASYNENPDLWTEASAITYANEQTPPTLYINSSHPRFAYGRDELFKILKKNNIYHHQHSIEGENIPHGFWLVHPWADETQQEIFNFLRTIF